MHRRSRLDLREVPFDVETFYTLLFVPGYLATRAASDARAEAADPFEIDMDWTLSFGATHALTHFYTGKEGTSLDQYVRTANDMLFSLATLERITDEYKRQAAAETGGDGQTGLRKSGGAGTDRAGGAGCSRESPGVRTAEATLRERFAEVAE